MKLFPHSREAVTVAAGLALVVTAAFHVPANASSPVHPRVQTTAAYSQSVSGSYVLGAANTDASNPFNDYAIEGEVLQDVGGVGVLGYGQQSKSYGVYGVTFGTNGIGVYGAGDGATPAPAATPNFATETTGVAGDSHGGNGVFGSTEWPGQSDAVINGVAGVYGIDNSTGSSENDGVYGATASGGFGTAGYAGDKGFAGVGGGGGGAIGVEGLSDSGYGIYGTSNSDYGIVGFVLNKNKSGVLGQASDPTSPGVIGQHMAGGNGVAGTSVTGNGVFATSTETTTANASLMAMGGLVGFESIASTGVASTSTSFPILAYSSDGTGLFVVTNSGNTMIYGNLDVHGTTGTYARTRDSAVAIHEYTPSSSHPTTEDIGQGRVVNGVGFVHLDPTFAAGIDSATPYAVFVTPNGDTRGYFVTGKSMTGFTVRETQGGRSTWDFDYRVVATKYGETGRRMAMVRQSDALMVPNRTPLAIPAALHSIKSAEMTSPKQLALRKSIAKLGPHKFFVARPNLAVEHRSQ